MAGVEDLTGSIAAMSENRKIRFPPTPHQMNERIEAVKESAPGKNGVRKCFNKKPVTL